MPHASLTKSKELTSGKRSLARLLPFNGRVHHLDRGYWLHFEIRREQSTKARLRTLRYAFTLHDPEGTTLLCFDNVHDTPRDDAKGLADDFDRHHWHRTRADRGQPYAFISADHLLADFFAEVNRRLPRATRSLLSATFPPAEP